MYNALTTLIQEARQMEHTDKETQRTFMMLQDEINMLTNTLESLVTLTSGIVSTMDRLMDIVMIMGATLMPEHMPHEEIAPKVHRNNIIFVDPEHKNED
jgi:hypothetical protein